MRRLLMPALLIFVFSGCNNNNVKEDGELKPYFDSAGVVGCFGFFDNGENSFTIYNLSRYRDSAFTPASTSKS